MHNNKRIRLNNTSASNNAPNTTHSKFVGPYLSPCTNNLIICVMMTAYFCGVTLPMVIKLLILEYILREAFLDDALWDSTQLFVTCTCNLRHQLKRLTLKFSNARPSVFIMHSFLKCNSSGELTVKVDRFGSKTNSISFGFIQIERLPVWFWDSELLQPKLPLLLNPPKTKNIIKEWNRQSIAGVACPDFLEVGHPDPELNVQLVVIIQNNLIKVLQPICLRKINRIFTRSINNGDSFIFQTKGYTNLKSKGGRIIIEVFYLAKDKSKNEKEFLSRTCFNTNSAVCDVIYEVCGQKDDNQVSIENKLLVADCRFEKR